MTAIWNRLEYQKNAVKRSQQKYKQIKNGDDDRACAMAQEHVRKYHQYAEQRD